MNECTFQPLLFGGDINVYSVARAFHELYGVKSIAYGKYANTFPCAHSQIIDYRPYGEQNDSESAFLMNVRAVAQEFENKTMIVVGCGDNYVKLIAHLKQHFPKNVKCNYISGDMLDRLTNKEEFYALCEKYGLPYPKTFVYTKDMGHNFELEWGAPYVAKPADGVAYWATGVKSLKKVYICKTWDELLESLDAVYAAGYPGKMILQEFIPGDDTHMHVLTGYSNQAGIVEMMCLGNTLLEEHSPHGIGNHAVIITKHEPYLCDKVRRMLENLDYVGFSNFDLKYDPRDCQYKFFEINCRQGRSNYYLTGACENVAQYLVDDLIIGRETPYTCVSHESLWRMVPMFVAYRFIPRQFHAKMKSLRKTGLDSHSLMYKGDSSLYRKFLILKNHIGNYVRFSKYCKKVGV